MQSNISETVQQLTDIQRLSSDISCIEFAPEVAPAMFDVHPHDVSVLHNEKVIQRSILEFQNFYNNL